jgi:hypothetical protein
MPYGQRPLDLRLRTENKRSTGQEVVEITKKKRASQESVENGVHDVSTNRILFFEFTTHVREGYQGQEQSFFKAQVSECIGTIFLFLIYQVST